MAIKPPNYTQYPNEILDDWMHKLSGSEFKVVSKIVRNTFGWKKNKDKISISQIEKSTGLGKTQIIKAIKILENHDLVLCKRENRKIIEFSIKIDGSESELDKSALVQKVNQTSSESEPELVQKVNPTKESNKETIQNKYYNDKMQEVYITWSLNTILQQHTTKTLIRNIKKRHSEIIDEIGIQDCISAISNYAFIIHRPKEFWYTHKYTFWRFLEKIDTFLDSADPLNNYKIKIKQEPEYKDTYINGKYMKL